MKFRTFALLAVAAALSPAALAQTREIVQPDCVIDFVFTAAGQTAGGAGTCGNNVAGVYEWRITYKSTGFSALSLVVQSAPDNAGAPGAWVTFVGTATGINPNTAITQATTNLAGFNPWVRVLLTSKTGTGTITGELYGCRQPGCSISGTTISAIVAIPNPLPVDGPTAAGAAPTTPPVLVAGQDGAPGLIRTIKTNSVGELIPSNASSAAVDGVSNTEATQTGAAGGILFPRAFQYVFNNTAWDRLRGNTSGLAIANDSSALADGLSNTQLSQTDVAGGVLYPRAFGHYFNGTSWDRAAGNTSGFFPANRSQAIGADLSTTQNVGAISAAVNLMNLTMPHVYNGSNILPLRGNNTGVTLSNASAGPNDATANNSAGPSDVTGASQFFFRVFSMIYNGDTTWSRQFNCPFSAPITFSAASGTLEIVALGASQIIRICHISLSSTVATNITLVYGTGTNCGTGTTSLSGAYQNVTTLALDFGPEAAVRTATSNAFCVTSSVVATVGGLVSYARF